MAFYSRDFNSSSIYGDFTHPDMLESKWKWTLQQSMSIFFFLYIYLLVSISVCGYNYDQ